MADPRDQKVVIIGAGQAAATTATTLRQLGFAGPVTMIGAEPAPPYQRPPLSKAYLKGAVPDSRLHIKPAEFYAAQEISLLLGETAVAIDRAARAVRTASGARFPYDKLVIATGSRPRPVPVEGADLPGALTLRTLADVDALRLVATAGKRLVVVGAGYIGLEAAAVARQMGLEVTVLEAADRVLSRVTSPILSEFYQELHGAAGTELRLGVQVAAFVGADGRISGVRLASGETIPADIVLVGAGILPNQELAEAAGLLCENGINTDALTRSDDPAIHAVGDCANRVIEPYGRRGRLESVHNAIETGRIAAAAIQGVAPPALDTPWFWSDQFEHKLQTAGLLTGYDEAIVRGSVSDRKFSVWYLKDGRVLAVDAVNHPGDFMAGKKAVGKMAADVPALADHMEAARPAMRG